MIYGVLAPFQVVGNGISSTNSTTGLLPDLSFFGAMVARQNLVALGMGKATL